jgi:hypothetical protein
MWKIKAQPSLAVYASRVGYVCIQQEEERDVCNNPCIVSIHPDAVTQVIERMQAALARSRGPDISAVKMQLPRDLKAYLHPTRPRRIRAESADYVYGTDVIELLPLRELKVEALRVRPQLQPLSSKDPHRSEGGYYAVPAVNLVGGDAAYSLLWLPVEKRYGTFDQEHSMLMAFQPKLTWKKLQADFDRYFGATNTGGDIGDRELAEYLAPWPTHSFIVISD